MIATRAVKPAFFGALCVAFGAAGWHFFMPDSAQAALVSAAALNIMFALVFALSIIIVGLLYIGPYRNPGWMSPGFAISLCLFGIGAFSMGEFVREAVRKPFVVYNVVLSNQVLPQEVPSIQKDGYLQTGVWTKAFVREHYPQTLVADSIQYDQLLKLPPEDRVMLGRVLYQHHCNDCHATTDGYSAVAGLLRGRTRAQVRSTVGHLNSVFFMPPWTGRPEEAELLTDYLMTIAPPRPSGMLIGTTMEEVR
jgi:uncharacterized membrane protein YgdD (TMEM256/DUF423 family)